MHLLSFFQEYFSCCSVTEVVQNVAQMDFQIVPYVELLKEFLDSFPKVSKFFGGLPSTEMIVQQYNLSFSLTKLMYRGGVTGTDVCK